VEVAVNRSVYIVAEIGNSHEGSLGLAKCFIRAAAECGANAVKFQTHIFEAESLPDAPNPPYFKEESREQYFQRTSFTLDQWRILKTFAEEECGVDFFSSPFSEQAVELLEKVGVATYKVPSGEVSNIPLLIKIARTRKRVLLSSGMSTWSEMDCAVDALKNNGCSELVLLQCTSEYPCQPEHAGLNVLQEMKERYGLPVGFSDHTLGSGVSLAAVCLGACVVEKHFTLSKRMYGPDSQFSATPEEFQFLVESIRNVEKGLTVRVDKDAEAATLAFMKVTFEKSIVAARDIPAGRVIGEEDLAYKKPGNGIRAGEFRDVLGRKANTGIRKNTRLGWEMLSGKHMPA
jgi:N,N'-diacetyllegionaminate synthase